MLFKSIISPLILGVGFCFATSHVVAAGFDSPVDYLVHSLPDAPFALNTKMYSGYIDIDGESDGHLFFWHFQAQQLKDQHRTIIWLNGGPGCSSMAGALLEIGPYTLKHGLPLEYDDASWSEDANILFVDSPIETGFSYSETNSYLTDLPEVAAQFLIFLLGFLRKFPEFQDNDIYLAGESFAGQYIPYIAKEILDWNKNAKQDEIVIKLQGVMIGNGWISPTDQYLSYLPFALERGLVREGSEIHQYLELQQNICFTALNAPGGKDQVYVEECSMLQDVLRLTQKKGLSGTMECVNLYNINLRDDYPSCGSTWPPQLTDLESYLQREDVLEALHVPSTRKSKFVECNKDVGHHFHALNSTPSINILPNLLSDIPVVLFSGDQDFICNSIGTEDLIDNMYWNGERGFREKNAGLVPIHHWILDASIVGTFQQARGMVYVKVFGASHMVPLDHGRVAREIFNQFLKKSEGSSIPRPWESSSLRPAGSIADESSTTMWILHGIDGVPEAHTKQLIRFAALGCFGVSLVVLAYYMWRRL